MDCSNGEEDPPSIDEGGVDSQHEEHHDGELEHEGGCELEEDPVAKTRKSYSRETKLAAIQYYSECKNKYCTAKQFNVKASTL